MKKFTVRTWLTFIWSLYVLLAITTIGLFTPIRGAISPDTHGAFMPERITFFSTLLFVILQGLLIGTMVWFLRRTILKPLDAIGKASKQIEKGNLHVSLSSSSALEMAEVVTSFNAMGQALRNSLAHQTKLEEERRFFISAIVHDLRTPLFSLRGYLEGLEKGIADNPAMVMQYTQICREKADDLEYLITNLFTYTQLEYLEMHPQREIVNMKTLLQKTIEAMHPLAERSGITISIKPDSSSYSSILAVDKRLLTRAIENLLDNAIRYTPPKGSIYVNWQRKATCFEFTIADTGPGIPPQDLPHIFEPLHRGETSRSRQTGGAGLGLTIAQQILRVHGGDLSATNREAGGALFIGFLPTPSIRSLAQDEEAIIS